MGRRSWLTVFAAIVSLGWSVGSAGERLVVYSVNYPLQYFAQRIAGEFAEVVMPVPPGVDPAFWQPDAAIIGDFQRADLILLNGAGYAKWVSRVSLPRRRTVDTSASFSERYIDTEGSQTHSHGREGDHSHAGTAFTTWLDFRQAFEQARAVRDALSRLAPERGDIFADNFLDLERDLLDLDTRLAAIVGRDPGRPLIASHPVYQYLVRRYSLNLESVMWEPYAIPPETEWRALAELRARHPAGWMLWESEPIAGNRERLQQLGVQSTVFHPCANRPQTGDFMSVMSENVQNLKQVFE
jgi:zinc transport system substrate-binding protein